MKRTIFNPKKQHEEVLWYVYFWNNKFSLLDVIYDSAFYKFQTRLGEVEAIHGEIIKRGYKTIKTRFGKKKDVRTYKRSVSKKRLIEIFNTYN